MTNAKIERTLIALKAFIIANIDTYVDRANLGTTGIQAEHLTDCVIADGFADSVARPYAILNLSDGRNESYQPQYHKQTLSVYFGVFIKEITSENVNTVQMRYIDAVIDMLNENPTLGGAVVEALLTDFDKFAFAASDNGGISFMFEILVESTP